MVEALYIAATQNQEAAVADYLEQELTAQTPNLKQLQQHFRQDCPKSFPQLTVTQHDLSSYDQLIESKPPQHSPERTTALNDSPESSPAPDAPPQAAPIDSHARALGIYRTPGYAADAIALRSPQRALHQAGAMVLCQILTSIMRTRNSTPQRSAAATSTCRGSTSQRKKFFAASALVQELQHAKLQLQLPALLRKLDRFDLLVLDDLGYVKKSEAETSVLFELIAHRYERKSLLITANQPFSQWDSIFSDSMMTVAAVVGVAYRR